MKPLLVVGLVLAVVATAAAQSPNPTAPFARVSLDPAGPVAVGQRVEMAIDVFVPTWFTSPPTLPPLDIDGAFAMPLPTTTHQVERVGSDTWSGVRYYYAITSQTPGTIHVPPVALTFRYAVNGLPSEPFTATTGPLAFEAQLPPGADRLDYFFAAADLELAEAYDPKPSAQLSVGDAFSRRILVSAPDVNALTLPPLPSQEVLGLDVTAEPPEITTTDHRGAAMATRSVRLTYVAKEPGAYTLPPIAISYWSTSQQEIRTRTLPAVQFDVAPATAFAEEIALPPDTAAAAPPPSRWASIGRVVRTWSPVVAGGIAALWAVWKLISWLGPLLMRRVAVARQRRLESESHFFAQVRRAGRAGDLRATHAAALAWLSRFPPLGGPPSLTALADRVGDAAKRDRMDTVNRSLFGRAATNSDTASVASQLARDVADARRRLLDRGRAPHGVRHLGPLNPA